MKRLVKHSHFGLALLIVGFCLMTLTPVASAKIHGRKPPVPPTTPASEPPADSSGGDDSAETQWDPDGGSDIPVTPWIVLPTPGGTGTPTTQPPNSSTGPQVVTPPMQPASGAATTTVVALPAPKPQAVCNNLPELTAVPANMDRNMANGVCTPKCLNHPEYTYLPDRWYKDAQGNCFARGWDNYGMCDEHGQYVLVAYPDVPGKLNSKYSMAIYVDGAGDDHHLNCLITDLATYKVNPKGFRFSGKYVQPGGPADRLFDSAQPYPQYPAMMPFYQYWVPQSEASQYVSSQTTVSIQAYGLLWYDGNRYATANAFAKKYLKRHEQSWRSWKQQNPNFAVALVTHQRLLRRR